MNLKISFVSHYFPITLIPLYCKISNDQVKNIIEFIISKSIMFFCIDDFSMDRFFSFVEKLVGYISNNVECSLSKLNDFSNNLIFDMLLDRFKISKRDLNSSNCEKLSKYIIENIRLKNYRFSLDNCWNDGYITIYLEKINGNVDSLYKRYLSLNMGVRDIFNYCLTDCVVDSVSDETLEKVIVELPNYDDLSCKLVCDSVSGKIKILNDSSIRIESDKNGKKMFVSSNGINEVELVKNILCDEVVFNEIISSDDLVNDRWIPYFSGHILDSDENIVKIFKLKNLYFPYISLKKRNDVSLMKKCISGDVLIPKDIIYLVGKDVLNDIDFLSLLVIKISDEDFDFYKHGVDSISESNMAYGKLIGKDVQKDEKFWNLLNSRIKLLNKKYALTIPLFDISREIVIASRYFDSINISD